MSALESVFEGLDACADDVASGRRTPEQVQPEVALFCVAGGPALVRSLERYYFAALRDASASAARKRVTARATRKPLPPCPTCELEGHCAGCARADGR